MLQQAASSHQNECSIFAWRVCSQLVELNSDKRRPVVNSTQLGKEVCLHATTVQHDVPVYPFRKILWELQTFNWQLMLITPNQMYGLAIIMHGWCLSSSSSSSYQIKPWMVPVYIVHAHPMLQQLYC
jgi:hypothetical protein